MRPELNPVVVVGGVLMLAGGFAFVGMGVLLMAPGWRMRGRATGTIIGTEWGDEGETLPVVTFTTAQGTNVRFVADDPLGVGSTRVGRLVRVRYDEGNPSQARIATFGRSYVGPLFLVTLGAVPLGLFAHAMSSL